MMAEIPAHGRLADGDLAAVWSPDDVRVRLEAAGRTLLAMPMPKGARPRDARSRWPEVVRSMQDSFFALVGASDQIKEDHAAARHGVRIAPTARAVAEMDEALQWLWLVKDARKRRLCTARALVHPVSDRHLVSYAKLGRIFGLHKDTMRIWHDRALAEIATTLTRDNVQKSRTRGRRRRR
jgi:hypothetical protein